MAWLTMTTWRRVVPTLRTPPTTGRELPSNIMGITRDYVKVCAYVGRYLRSDILFDITLAPSSCALASSSFVRVDLAWCGGAGWKQH